MKSSERGQSLLEFLLGLGLVTITLVGSGWVFKLQWDRAKCAYLTFTRTRDQLNQSTVPVSTPPGIEVRIDQDGVTGTGRCGTPQESVRLQNIETQNGEDR